VLDRYKGEANDETLSEIQCLDVAFDAQDAETLLTGLRNVLNNELVSQQCRELARLIIAREGLEATPSGDVA
jgi:hypothetical protein